MFLMKNWKLANRFVRYCSNLIIREYEVPIVCNINANIPYKTILTPRNPFEADTDKLIIKCERNIDCNVVGASQVNISTVGDERDENVVCEIEAPMKSSLNVMSYGDIEAKDFHGSALRLCSEHGNITIGNNKNDEVAARTMIGNITTVGSIEAAKVTLKALKSGSITANKLKCLGLHIETDDGNVHTEACYASQTYIVTLNGHLNLLNVHKHSKIMVLKNGSVRMTGFDGLLELIMQNGKADVQIAAMTGRSEIRIKDEGNLTLRLGDAVREDTLIDIDAKSCTVEDGIPFDESEEEEHVTIKPKLTTMNGKQLSIKCTQSYVTVKAESWAEAMQKAINSKNN